MAELSSPSVGIIIPARFGSSRFPGKPLELLRGADGIDRPLIEHSWRAASAVRNIRSVWIATDDQRIAEVAGRFGGEVVMTPADCANGTERCAAAVSVRGDAPDIIVNLQGDAPLTPETIIGLLIDRLHSEEALAVATPAIRCSTDTYRHLLDDQQAGRVGGTTVVFDGAGHALYFSKRIIPYVDDRTAPSTVPVYLHLGVYAYHRDALERYAGTPCSELEQLEGLEQLRFLHSGARVGVVVCDLPGWDVIEVNNPTDVPIVEAMLQRRGAIERSRTDATLRS